MAHDLEELISLLADEVEAAVGSGVCGMHGTLRQHQPIAGKQRVVLVADTERDLAPDYPEALRMVWAWGW
jgi:hypothetical protein